MYQFLNMPRLNLGLLLYEHNILIHPPDVDPLLDILSISAETLAFSLADFDHLPYALGVAILEGTYLDYLHLLVFDLDELVVVELVQDLL
jgi:hypothetical protein